MEAKLCPPLKYTIIVPIFKEIKKIIHIKINLEIYILNNKIKDLTLSNLHNNSNRKFKELKPLQYTSFKTNSLKKKIKDK